MAKRRRRARAAARRKVIDPSKLGDVIADMEQPLLELGALLWAFDLISAGMQGRGDDEGGDAVAMVAECARARLETLRKHWNLIFAARPANP